MTKKLITNVKCVTDYMEYGSPLRQAFVMQALGQFASLVIREKENLLKQKDNMINMEAWVKCAEDWQEAYKKQQENNR